jgi:hypothetical protein
MSLILTMRSSFLFIRGSSGFDHAVDNEIGHIMRQDASTALSYQQHTSMHTIHTIASSIANVFAGRQPLASIPITDTRHIRPAENFVDPFTVRFAADMPVARSPVLDQDEDHRVVTIPMAGQAQTPIRRRVKVVHKTDYENGSFVFDRRTPNRPMALRSPPPPPPPRQKRRVVEEENVTEEMKEEYGAWLKARIIAAKHSASAKKVWWC